MYTYTRLAHDTGQPLVRGMYLDYPEQEGSYTYRRQYMFGHELLAAPVSEPGYGKPVLKDVYLPAGEKWFDYFTGRIYEGGQTLPYSAPSNGCRCLCGRVRLCPWRRIWSTPTNAP